MPETVQMNFNIQGVTKARVKEMAAAFRNPGDFIDWLVNKEWESRAEAVRIAEVLRETPAPESSDDRLRVE